MTTILQIPLSKLLPGDKAKGGSINSRKTPEPIDGLARSIEAHGLLVPLLVRSNGAAGTYYVMDGNRRLEALQKLAKKDHSLTANGVPCIAHEHGAALELSMVVNVDRASLHPVDMFEVFAALVEAGETVDAIAKRRGMKVAHVRQALALGKLAPAVREAWRDGRISADTAETFALTSDHKAQEAALKKAGKHPHEYAVRRLIVGGDKFAGQHVDNMLKVVGRDAYEKAGHFINASLFSDENDDKMTVSDLPALQRMVSEKIEAECERLKEQGWKWAIDKADAPNDIYGWKRVTQSGAYSKEQMAQLGCVVGLSYGGVIEIARGYVKPGDKIATPKSPKQKKAAAKDREDRKEETGGISNALAFRLSTQLTVAVQEAFTNGAAGDVATACAIAALACYGSPMGKLRLDVADEKTAASRHDNDFAKYLKLALGKTTAQRSEMLALWLSHAIDLTVHHAPQLATLLHPGKEDDRGVRLLVEQINEKQMLVALRKWFDPADYFNSVSKGVAEDAILEALGKEHHVRATKLKASEVREYAIKHVSKTGWVPPQLRLGKAVRS